ncbi:MAG: hypothetical protein VR68_13035 [Peptococcaceae bacterium BRH_c4a]|nr:MAG: hypothetical protein VR68_13035 [Peptococcaceae bacterium BRH_c4a]
MPIIPVLKEELERLKDMEKGYLEKISGLPRGSIKKKIIKGRPYYYLMYREGPRVRTKYLKLSEQELEELSYKLSLRQKYEKALREVRRDCRLLGKVVK